MGNVETKETTVIVAGKAAGTEDDSTKNTLNANAKKSCLMAGVVDDDVVQRDEKNDTPTNSNVLKKSETSDKSNGPSETVSRRKSQFDDLLQEEIAVRNKIRSMPGAQGKGGVFNVVSSTIINMVSAFLVFAVYLISLESLLSIGLCVGFTIYTYNIYNDNPNIDGSIMNWVLLSFAVITPLSAAIRMSFSRRELANTQIANFKATMIHLYSSHLCWDWYDKQGQSGRAVARVDWREHNDDLLRTMCQVSSKLTRLLTLPTAGRGRHRVISYGRKQRAELAVIAGKLRRSILEDMNYISDKCEVLKREGLPPNEATRIRQWERFITTQVEQLLVIKRYRTPQALRSFARIFSVFLPPFYAPFYAKMAEELNSLGIAISFSILTSIALTSLFESVFQLEDPFVGSRLDCIDVEADLRDEFFMELLDLRNYYFPDAPPFEAKILIPSPERSPEIRLFRA
ncbi:hypothetical protein IV203_026202 [Nitzschia inconspicua]|uniref:Uncharacterized protein n=1 Tax=Nitzschia inconspicua TaxID=303405 RepID=A0A9K3LIW9_9STRA|nr:hypothetical protein IV203_026202 [Nitzschia inconspicua]